MIKNKIIAFGLAALSISAYASEIKVEYNKKYDINREIKQDKEFRRDGSNAFDTVIPEEFKLVGTDFLYKGEVVDIADRINPVLSVYGAYANNKVLKLEEGNPLYDKYNTSNDDVEVSVDQETKIKTVKFKNKYAVYLTLIDEDGNKKTLELNQEIKVKDAPENLVKDKMRYVELKKLNEDPHLNVSVVNYKYEMPGDEAINWEKTFTIDKYKDLDDLTGIHKVEVKEGLNGALGKIKEYNIDFGYKLDDFKKDDYNKLYLDLSNKTLKFTDDKGNIENGFDPYYTSKISIGPNDKLEFVTKILDKDNKTVGYHNIERQILLNGVVVNSKKERAYIAFPGTTVAIADSSFITASPELESRMIRYIPKGLDSRESLAEIEKGDKTGINGRPHGHEVIGAMIDEVTLGDQFFWKNFFDSRNFRNFVARFAINYGDNVYKNGTPSLPFSLIQSNISNVLMQYVNSASFKEFYSKSPIFEKYANELTKVFNDGLDDFNSKIDELEKQEKTASTEEEKEKIKDEKVALIKERYIPIFHIFEKLTAVSEEEKLKSSDLHFAAIALEDGGLKTNRVDSVLSRILDENKNIKVINMSYGSGYNYEEYRALKDATPEQIKKAAEEYNNNPVFRQAVLSYLYDYDNSNIEKIQQNSPGTLGIGSMYKYFLSKDKITPEEYKQIINLQLLTYKSIFSELDPNSNRDIVFVISQGNSRGNSGQTQVDLVGFDENDKKIIYKDNNHYYGNANTAVIDYYNELAKEKAKKEGKEYKYDPMNRKNLLTVVGLQPSRFVADENNKINDEWGINTGRTKFYLVGKLFSEGMTEMYDDLLSRYKDIKENPQKYTKEYANRIKEELETIDRITSASTDPDGRDLYTSFTRAGTSKLDAIAAEGEYVITKDLKNDEKDPSSLTNPKNYIFTDSIGIKYGIQGSSFSAPRVTAVSGEVGTRFPWMTAHQIKQTVLTTALDDFVITGNGIKGLYGIDSNIGWGILDRDKAYNGPARFTKVLTSETHDDDFIANIPYGTYEFSNDIKGGFNKSLYFLTRRSIKDQTSQNIVIDFSGYNDDELSKLTNDDLKNKDDLKDRNELKPLLDIGFTGKDFVDLRNSILDAEIQKLPIQDRDMFVDAGLVKQGNGTLILSGVNTYKDPTIVEGGTLIVQGTSKSPIVVHKGTKLKIDMAATQGVNKIVIGENFENSISDVYNFGEVYSYSKDDKIDGVLSQNGKAKLHLAAIAGLKVDELDLANTNEFNFDIFRKKGMLVFKTPTFYEEGEFTTAKGFESDAGNDLNNVVPEDADRKLLLSVNKISKMDLAKVRLGKTAITPNIDMLVVAEPIEGNDKEDSLKVYLQKHDYLIEKEPENIKNLKDMVAKNSDVLAEDIDFLTASKREGLDGQILSSSMLTGYEIDSKVSEIINSNLGEGKYKKYNLFASALTSFKNKGVYYGEDFLNITGGVLGVRFNYKYYESGVSLNYGHTFIKNINSDGNENSNVNGDNLGLSLFTKGKIKGAFLSLIANANYINKRTTRKILDDSTSKLSSNDGLFSLNARLGYEGNIKDVVKITPYITTTLTDYVRGKFDENTEFGFKSERKNYFKAKVGFGTNIDFNISKNIVLGVKGEYTRYLTSNVLEDKASLSGYDFSDEVNIKGVELPLNDFLVNVNSKFNLTNNLSLNASYTYNPGFNTLTAGLNYEF